MTSLFTVQLLRPLPKTTISTIQPSSTPLEGTMRMAASSNYFRSIQNSSFWTKEYTARSVKSSTENTDKSLPKLLLQESNPVPIQEFEEKECPRNTKILIRFRKDKFRFQVQALMSFALSNLLSIKTLWLWRSKMVLSIRIRQITLTKWFTARPVSQTSTRWSRSPSSTFSVLSKVRTKWSRTFTSLALSRILTFRWLETLGNTPGSIIWSSQLQNQIDYI